MIESIMKHEDITLLYASKETVYNNAEAFKEILEHFDEFRNYCSENVTRFQQFWIEEDSR